MIDTMESVEADAASPESPVENQQDPSLLIPVHPQDAVSKVAVPVSSPSEPEPARGTSGDGGGGVQEIAHVQFIDHFSLGNPSSSVRFRNKRVVLYGMDNDDEIVLESASASPWKDGNHDNTQKVTVKRYRTSSPGMNFLRTIYTLVSLLILGFLVAFCFQIIAFLFLNMAANGGDTAFAKGELNVAHVCAVLASVPLYLYAMASILAMGTAVVQDTWKGNPLFQQLLGFSNDVLMEAICVVIFLIIPGSTAAFTLMASRDDWWETTALVWVMCVLFFMAAFALLVVINEVAACLELMQIQMLIMDQADAHATITTAELVKGSVLNTQIMFYSGYQRFQYLQGGGGGGGDDDSRNKQVIKSQTSLYSRMTILQKSYCCCIRSLFTILDPPVRVYTADEVRDVVPIYTSRNWSLERMFCRNPDKAAVFVQKGPGALRKNQIGASLAFSIIGAILVILLVAGFLVWWAVPPLFVALFSLFFFLCVILPVIASTIRLYRMYHHQPIRPSFSLSAIISSGTEQGLRPKNDGDDDDDHDHDSQQDDDGGAIFQVWERMRISEPKPSLCWVMAGLTVGIGFLWPLISFLVNTEYTTATFFGIMGAFSIPRLYLNPVPILRKMGPLEDLPLSSTSHSLGRRLASSRRGIANLLYGGQQTEEESILRRKAKLSAIVGKINNRSIVAGWMYFFGVLMGFVAIFCLAAFKESLDGVDYKVKVPEGEPFFAHDFYYPPQPKLPYPTCTIAKHFSLLDAGQESKLIDIAFLSIMSFSAPDESDRLMADWFGNDTMVVDESQFVQQYLVDIGRTNGVSFKLFSFPDNPGVGLVSIRGSESLLDWIVDVQLWLGAALAQMVRGVVPLGWMWTPILDDLVYLINSVESDNLKKVSYYTTTTSFINAVLSGEYGDGNYTELRVTGASLGGGLAIITGAQTNTSTVAISGLNSMLSRLTYDPPVTEEALNTHVFNVIPDRDPISHIDDPGRLIQRTACRAPKNSFFGCHSMWRSLCELSYQCGSMNRPALCWCVSKYGYPEPIQNGTQTFAEVCPPDTSSS